MEQKINIAELLKDCPTGMELDCTMYEDVYFDYVDELNNIRCYIQQKFNKTSVVFNQDGAPNSHTKSKCVIFPKEKTTWEGFQRPFEDGDVVATSSGTWIGITTGGKSCEFMPTYCVIKGDGEFEVYLNKKETWQFHRLATEEEKAKLFQVIKDNGYKWNAETKTLEKLVEPKFNVGDKVVKKGGVSGPISITGVGDEYYYSNTESYVGVLPIVEQDNWELVPNKFDISTLKPFDKVLVRDKCSDVWTANFYSHYDATSDRPFVCVGWSEMNEYRYCIPYEANKELLGTTNNIE